MKTTMIVCPRCPGAGVYRTKARGFFELRLLPLVGIRPFRCPSCGRRFFKFSSRITPALGEQGENGAMRSTTSAFLKTEDELTFQQLIRQMSEAERRLQGGESAEGKVGN